MHIAEVKISGVRGFSGPRSVHLRLNPDAGWTVLAGRNGSGKTSLLRALALAMAGPSVARSLMPGGFDGWISHEVLAGTAEVEIELDPNVDHFSGSSAKRPKSSLFARLTEMM